MDFSKFKPSDWLKAGGGLVMLIAYFLTWWSIDGAGSLGEVSGTEYFFTGTIPWLLLIAVGVLTVLSALDIFKLPKTIPAPLVFLAASVLAFLLILVRFFSDGFDSGSAFGVNVDIPTSRGAGLFLALLAAIAVVAGSVLGFKESGGNLNDLKDVNKLKNSFGGPAGGPPPPPGMQPPPPPPSSTPPPPPPPRM